MGREIPVEVTGITKPYEVRGHLGGAHVNMIIFHYGNGWLTVDAQNSIFAVDLHTDHGAFRQDDGPVYRQVRGDWHQ